MGDSPQSYARHPHPRNLSAASRPQALDELAKAGAGVWSERRPGPEGGAPTRPWVGAGVPKPAVAVLDPARPIPAGVQILTVAGVCERWDRLHPAARTDSPECFERPTPAARR